MVKLKEDKQVGQNFIELKHMAVVILLNYLKTKDMLKVHLTPKIFFR